MSQLKKKFISKNKNDLSGVASYLRSIFSGRDILLLSGPMGVGKTELVRSLVSCLHGGEISSPSFAIHNNYSAGDLLIDHLDLFRIEGDDDLESTGFWDLFDQKTGLIILEWADKLDLKLLPPNWKKVSVSISFLDENSRQLWVEQL